MAKTRLNESMRKAILNAALEDTFGERENRLLRTKVEIAHQIRSEYLESRGLTDCIEKMPRDLVNMTSHARVKYGDGMGEIEGLPFTEEAGAKKRANIKASHAFPETPVDLGSYSKSAQGRFHAMRQERDRIKAQRKDLEEALRGLLWSVNTTNQLVAEWPEGEKYVPAVEASNAPAVRGQTVTKKIREYSEEAA